jgi:hypothetical protein
MANASLSVEEYATNEVVRWRSLIFLLPAEVVEKNDTVPRR